MHFKFISSCFIYQLPLYLKIMSLSLFIPILLLLNSRLSLINNFPVLARITPQYLCLASLWIPAFWFYGCPFFNLQMSNHSLQQKLYFLRDECIPDSIYLVNSPLLARVGEIPLTPSNIYCLTTTFCLDHYCCSHPVLYALHCSHCENRDSRPLLVSSIFKSSPC